jgi:hypothetical protein
MTYLNALIVGLALIGSSAAHAFCGFYAAKAGSDLFNQASKVVLVRDGNRTVMSMASDYKGSPSEFALVIPVPTILQKKQINVGDPKVLDHLDAFTAPRLVEYFDSNPCEIPNGRDGFGLGSAGSVRNKKPMPKGGGNGLGVKIEARYEVGEYDILILSAKESSGLETWLKRNKYKVPKGAGKILKSYIKRNLKFFVAKVNLERHKSSDYSFLRPLQIAFESTRFELPVRLGTVNSKGPQDLFIFALTKKGRVETVNYRTKKIPTGQEVPVYVKEQFKDFYQDLFSTQVKRDGMKAVYMEYAWNMNWCDPCAAEPLTPDELRSLGVYWVKDKQNSSKRLGGGGVEVFVTRLHARYTAKTFPSDLSLQVTSDKNNFQGRYVIRHPYKGDAQCKAMDLYRKELPVRLEKEAQTLASLTGWEVNKVRREMKIKSPKSSDKSWIDDLWK